MVGWRVSPKRTAAEPWGCFHEPSLTILRVPSRMLWGRIVCWEEKVKCCRGQRTSRWCDPMKVWRSVEQISGVRGRGRRGWVVGRGRVEGGIGSWSA